jgi:parvulin-like peptidyl-prolyl isomerase
MRHRIRKPAFIQEVGRLTAILWALVLAASPAADAAPAGKAAPKHRTTAKSLPPDAAARVNGEILPERIVAAFLQNGQEELGIDPNTEEGGTKLAQLRKHIIDEQIERLLIAQETVRRKIEPTKEKIDKAEQNIIDARGDEARYAQFLEQNHFSRENYRHYVLRSALCGEAMAATFAADIKISDEEIQKYYEAHKIEPEFQRPERVTAAHILFTTRRGILAEQLKLERGIAPGPELDKAVDAEIERRRKLAEEVRKEASAPGADFGALAQKYSDDFGTRNKGGSLATFAKGTHPLPLDEVAFRLKPGEIGPVVETEFGFHVVKKMEHRPAGTKTLEEATPHIHQRLTRAALAKKMREWLAQAREKASIAIRAASPPPTAAPQRGSK